MTEDQERINIFSVVRVGDEDSLRRIVREYRERTQLGKEVASPTFFTKIASLFYTEQNSKVSVTHNVIITNIGLKK
jgi:hypothetical protein